MNVALNMIYLSPIPLKSREPNDICGFTTTINMVIFCSVTTHELETLY